MERAEEAFAGLTSITRPHTQTMQRIRCLTLLAVLDSINSAGARILHHLLPWLPLSSSSSSPLLLLRPESATSLGGVRAVTPVTLLHCGGVWAPAEVTGCIFSQQRASNHVAVVSVVKLLSQTNDCNQRLNRKASAPCHNYLMFNSRLLADCSLIRGVVMASGQALRAGTAAVLHHSLWFRWQAGFCAPGNCMTCSLTRMLSEDTWWPVEEKAALHFFQVWMLTPALKLTANTAPPVCSAWGNLDKAAGTIHKLAQLSLCCAHNLFLFLFFDTVGTFRRWAALTARTALPRKQSGKTTSPWSQRAPMGSKREWVSCGTRLWCVASSLCTCCLRSCVVSSWTSISLNVRPWARWMKTSLWRSRPPTLRKSSTCTHEKDGLPLVLMLTLSSGTQTVSKPSVPKFSSR